ncbi:MAG TPA: MASE4 domain-containing protein [Pyrinomonadaceae bacterium]|nr:MASE4 domain-containing protein [Pyrinomonadaceae bacterium]
MFLSTAAATRKDYRLALFVCAVLAAAFLLTAPWAGRQLPAQPTFVPIYNAAVIVLDLITALLLYAQFRQLKRRSCLALACGYLFTPPVMAAHTLSFPEAFGPGTLFGGEQTTAWLWMGWHGLFPFFAAAYALLLRREEREGAEGEHVGKGAAASAVFGTLALAAVVILLTTAGERWLPELMLGSSYKSQFTRLILSAGWLSHLATLALLVWATRLRRLLDIWVGVTLAALVCDLALSAILVTGRYQLGFYMGRVYGLLGAVFVLAVLLREAVALYGDAVRAAASLRESEEKYRAVFNSINEGFSLLDIQFDERGEAYDIIIRDANPAQDRIDGVRALVGKRVRELFPDLEQKWIDRYANVARTGEPEHFEDWSEVTQRWYEVDASRVGGEGSSLVAIVYNDVTERKRGEEALRTNEERLRRANEELEERVLERTEELEELARNLLREVKERAAAETRVKNLLRQLVTVQEEERRRIARELHDTLGQQLAALRMSIEVLKVKSGGDGLREDTERMQSIFDQLNSDVDFLAWELRPVALDHLGLDAALRSFVRDWSEHFRVAADYHGFGPDAPRLPSEVETNLYRILQEALQNVHKHAGATRVSVLLERRDGRVVLIVEDDGRGFDPEAEAAENGERGMGVTNMRERASLLGGSLEVESASGAGTTLFVRVPVRPQEKGSHAG